MKHWIKIVLILVLLRPAAGQHLFLKGQATGWGQSEFSTLSNSQVGFRYLPELNAGLPMGDNLLDAAVAWNVDGVHDWQTDTSELRADPYRLWARYSSRQFELRLGLQKINFGSALILRPLMWFDQLDPRDVTRFTTGVWGGLMRYYFLNNTNIWLWGLYGNDDMKGLEWLPTTENTAEFGGRLQMPLFGGEAAVTVHHRQADVGSLLSNVGWIVPQIVIPESIPEYRLGIDGKWDVGIGLWLESALVIKDWQVPAPYSSVFSQTVQRYTTVGADYTFGVGNGLHATAEHMLVSLSNEWDTTLATYHVSALMADYPISIFDTVLAVWMQDWENNDFYQYYTWRRTYDRLTLNASVFFNPENGQSIFTGGRDLAPGISKGFQIMVVYHH